MGKAHIKAKKPIIDGITFDSQHEADYYLHLLEQPDVLRIKTQPQFTFIEPFHIICQACHGGGQTPSPKTGNQIQCKKCSGEGKRKRQGWIYHADFAVDYEDGRQEIVDVKGWANERFPLVKKMFEHQQGRELVVIQKKKGEWVRK